MMTDAQRNNNGDSVVKPTAASPKPPLPPYLWNLVILMGVGVYSSYSILVHLCEVQGHIPFSSGALNFCIETMKLTLSLSMFYCTEQLNDNTRSSSSSCFWFPRLKWRTILNFSVPAVLYCINNNLAVYIQLEMDPATYQILGNMKILTTAVLFRIIMKKEIPRLQCIALGLLLLSGVANSFGGLSSNPHSTQQNSNTNLHITFPGLLMITFYCTVSGLAGVYTEYVLKKQMEINLHLQNALLYTFGLGLNTFTFIVQTASKSNDLKHPFHGFTVYAWAIVITQAVGGIIMGAVMKYATNITRLFIISSAVVVTTVASVLIFGLHLNLWFAMSFLLVFISLILYHSPPPSTSASVTVSPSKV